MILAEQVKIVGGANALLNAAAFAGSTYALGDAVSLKNYNHVTAIVRITPASGTDTAAITLKQSTAVALTGEKALGMSYVWKNAAVGTSDALVKTAVVANSVTTSAVAADEMFVFEIDANQLDVANGFDCVRVDITDPGSVSTPCNITYILSEPRFAAATPPTAITD